MFEALILLAVIRVLILLHRRNFEIMGGRCWFTNADQIKTDLGDSLHGWAYLAHFIRSFFRIKQKWTSMCYVPQPNNPLKRTVVGTTSLNTVPTDAQSILGGRWLDQRGVS